MDTLLQIYWKSAHCFQIMWASLGGCVVEVDENLEPLNQMEDIEVCNECTQGALKYLNCDE